MAEWKRFFAKTAKSFENQCETEGARSHQSLWKPFRFWFVSLNFWEGGFGATVSHLMVPELEQRSATPARSAGRKNGQLSYFSAKSEKSVTAVTWVRTSFLLKVVATEVPTPNESFFEQIGDQRFRI